MWWISGVQKLNAKGKGKYMNTETIKNSMARRMIKSRYEFWSVMSGGEGKSRGVEFVADSGTTVMGGIVIADQGSGRVVKHRKE